MSSAASSSSGIAASAGLGRSSLSVDKLAKAFENRIGLEGIFKPDDPTYVRLEVQRQECLKRDDVTPSKREGHQPKGRADPPTEAPLDSVLDDYAPRHKTWASYRLWGRLPLPGSISSLG